MIRYIGERSLFQVLNKHQRFILRVLLSVFNISLFLSPLHAAFITFGNVNPTAPASWILGTEGYIGNISDGSLTVNLGSDLFSANAYLGNESGATGQVTVDGTGSTWTDDHDLYIGNSGNGILNVTNGGNVSSIYGYLGNDTSSRGEVKVDGTGSKWTNSYELYVGNLGSGTLSITTGGSVNNTSFNKPSYIGFNSGSIGQVNVNGLGSRWTNCSNLYIGNSGTGTLNITDGGCVNNTNVNGYGFSYIGNNSGSIGLVNVNGNGSSWNNPYDLYVGYSGSGALNISNSGVVMVTGATYVAYNAGSTGSINFGPGGGTLTTGSLMASPSQLSGTGTINAHGLVSDIDVVFDVNHPQIQAIPINSITLNLDLSTSDLQILGAGYLGNGSLTIRDGVKVASYLGYIGMQSGSTGKVTVDGTASKWTNGSSLYVGNSGKGTLNITGGGCVESGSYRSYIGYNPGARGEVTVDGTGSTWTNCDLFIGYSGSGVLNISAGGMVTSNGTTYVAYNPGSTGSINFGTGGGTLTTKSLWSSPSQLSGSGTIIAHGMVSDIDIIFDSTHGLVQSFPIGKVTVNLDLRNTTSPVGSLGAGYAGNGSLIIRDGIRVGSDNGFLGMQTGSSGVVSVVGSGSLWSNWYFYVGNSGHGTLNVSGGGNVNSYNSYIGYNSGSTGEVKIDGNGSKWTTNLNLYIGNSGNGILNITGGGYVSNAQGYIGYNSTSTGNALITGASSTWNLGELYVGYSGSGTLNISDGGSVTNSGTTYVAYNSSSTGSIKFGTGGGKLTTRSILASPNQLIGTGTINTNGLVSDVDLFFDSTHGLTQSLTINGVTVNLDLSNASLNGYLGVGYAGKGSLTIQNGKVVSPAMGILGYNSGSAGIMTVDGTGSKWTSSTGSLKVGNSGIGTLNIINGGMVSTNTGSIGCNSGSTGVVKIDGTNSKWTLESDFYVGNSGSGSLNITGSGTFSDSYGLLYIGNQAGSIGEINIVGAGSMTNTHDTYLGCNFGSSGTVNVNGASAKWTASTLYVGASGSGSVKITVGGAVNNGYCYIGCDAGSVGEVDVDGIGSKWISSQNIYIGKSGVGNLHITGGSAVSNSNGYGYNYLGYNAKSTGEATVDGTGSIWTNNGYLYVGKSGNGKLNISHGGSVTVTRDVFVAWDAGSSGSINFGAGGGTLTAGSLIATPSQLSGAGTIIAHGMVSDVDLAFDSTHGLTQSIQLNSVVVNLDLRNASANGALGAGDSGKGTLTIRDGISVSSTTGYLGLQSGSNGTFSVDGAGSKWTYSSSLYIGYFGNGTLNITHGGAIINSNVNISNCIGNNVGSVGAVTVDGAGSTWNTFSGISVGMQGNGELNITHGGYISSSSGSIGTSSGSTGMVKVDGTGSKWNSTSGLLIGDSGNGILNITNGGSASNGTGSIGNNSGSTGDVNVAGAGSKWTNNSSLIVGYSGNGKLHITNGGTVTVNPSYNSSIGLNAGSTGTVTIDGVGSAWTSQNDLYIGNSGSGTLNLSGGCSVSIGGTTFAAYNTGSTGSIIFGTGGGTLTTRSLMVSPGQLSGVGTINARGLVCDVDVAFDSTHPLIQSIPINGITLNLDLSNASLNGVIGAGYRESGSLSIRDGIQITSAINGYIGLQPGSVGSVNVAGTGAVWTNASNFYVIGNSGNGTLNITDGGSVINTNTSGGCAIGYNSGSTGIVAVEGTSSKWSNAGYIEVAYHGNGTLNVTNGGFASSSYCDMGYYSGSVGIVNINGSFSKWANKNALSIGRTGSGMLNITNGGAVTNSYASIGYNSSSSGIVKVDGLGSTWTNDSYVYIGNYGTGTLYITGGGVVTASSISIDYQSLFDKSLLAIDVGAGSLLSVGNGSGTITNSGGTIRFLAGASPTSSAAYSPISASTWNNYGTIQSVGGTWNSTSHVFTVSQMLSGFSGTPVTIDLSQKQRVLVESSPNHWKVGASFLAKTGIGNSLDFTATSMTDAEQASLKKFLEPGQSVLSGWNFAAKGSGYNSNDPVYLSFGIPANLSAGDLYLWRLSGSTWSYLSAGDLTIVKDYASFTVFGMSGYAVTAVMPQPTWKNAANGIWQDGNNWSTNTVPNGVGVAATLGPVISAPQTVTLSGPVTVGALTINSPQHYTLAGMAALSLEASLGNVAEINVLNSDTNGQMVEIPVMMKSPLEIFIASKSLLTLAGEVQNPTGQDLTLFGGGALTVLQGIITTGAINVQEGTLNTPNLNANTLTIGSVSTSPFSAVPEPSSLLILLTATAGFIGRFRKCFGKK